MLKRTLAILLVLICLAVAASAETVPYTSVTGQFAIDIPADYVPVTGELVKLLMQSEDGKAVLNAMGFTDDMMALISDVDFGGIDFIYASDFVGNLNISCQESGGLTMTLMEMFYPTLDSELKNQYAAYGVAEKDMQPLGIVTKGANRFYGFKVNMLGLEMGQYIICGGNDLMVTLTGTAFDEAVMNAILASFRFVG